MIDICAAGLASFGLMGLVRGTSIIPSYGSTEGLEKDQELVDRIRARMNFVDPVEVRATPKKGIFEFSAFGGFMSSYSTVMVPQKGDNAWNFAYEATRPFIYAHELAHIEANDIWRISTVFSVTLIATAIILHSVGVILPLALITAEIVALVAVFYFSQIMEKQADLRAAENCKDEEIAAGIWFFEMSRLDNLQHLKDIQNESTCSAWWDRLFYAENGDDLLDIAHPPLSERIRYLKESICDPCVRDELEHHVKLAELEILETSAQGA